MHAQDIRRPLELPRTPPIEAVGAVARFYARRDFAGFGRSTIEGLRLEATDGPFSTGAGPLVSGTTLALTMAMAGRLCLLRRPHRPGRAYRAGPLQPALNRRTSQTRMTDPPSLRHQP